MFQCSAFDGFYLDRSSLKLIKEGQSDHGPMVLQDDVSDVILQAVH